VNLPIEVHRGLDEKLRRLQSVNNPDVLYPVDYIRNVDRGRIAIGQFDLRRELTQAESILASLNAGKDPFAGRTGDFKRHYLLEEAGEIMPYRVYVPTSYKGDRAYPLIIALHGNGATEDNFFTGFEAQLPRLAGYIVAAPLGYRVDGGYGRNNGSRSIEELPKLELSEKDVMHVLDLMKRDYRIDPDRTYVAGHSMGGGGAWYLAPRYPQIWAAIASFAGGGDPNTMSGMKHIPQFIVHGDADATASVEQSRTMVAEMKRIGVEHQYIEVPGGTHGGVVAPNLRAMFDYFDKQKRTPATR
jgi:predicted peptidase